MDTAGTKLGLGYCCSREQPLPREIMRSKTATGKATVTTEPDEHHCIHWEAFLVAQHPPSRKGEKPSDSCAAVLWSFTGILHMSQECVTAHIHTHIPALQRLPADSQPREKETEL